MLKRLIPETHPLRLLWHRAKAFVAALRYGFPARKLKVIGITGTDGKTTTVGMLAHILHKRGVKVGALSTAFFRINEKVEWNATQKTSPSPFTIQKFLRRLVSEDCTFAVIECSSHGLLQGRTNYLWPRVAGITNISSEHLDYHGTMEAYIDAKARLFRMIQRDGTKVINASDRSFDVLKNITTTHTIVFASNKEFGPPASDHERSFWASDIRAHPKGTDALIRCNTSAAAWPLRLPVMGTFNIDNALCAIGCAHACGVEEARCVEALSDFTGIPGRMERIDEGQPFSIFVDFTVTPASYEATLSTLKQMLHPGQRILALTGSCGDRMKEKRPVVGKIVSSYADVMVVANEDPYTEDPEKIIDEVWAGIDHTKTKAHRIFDRRKAIEFLLNEARLGDLVILCGKGSDTTMWMKNGQIPWNEREIVREILRAKKQ